MKLIAVILSLFYIASCASAREKSYTGSTPAAPVVKSFLGIPVSDSIDFIRWKLTLRDNQYQLHCNYGIGKPNTNGFINGGTNIELSGVLKKEKNYYHLQNRNKTLKIVEVNADLLLLLNSDNSLLVGNGGWSYTLNNLSPSVTDQVNIAASSTVLRDSMAFEGRTPCGIPGVIAPGRRCYKLKWYIILYNDNSYRIPGSPWYSDGGRKGKWKITKGKEGRITYQLKVDKENIVLYLLKLDENILVFTDADGKLLTGNEDFSYTMNRRW